MAETLDAIIARVRAYGATAATETAKAAAPGVLAALRATAAAGTAPDGTPWQPKKDGGRPLVNAAEAITVEAKGGAVIATLAYPEVVHHRGSKRVPQRRILPDPHEALPAPVVAAVGDAAILVFQRAMGGR